MSGADFGSPFSCAPLKLDAFLVQKLGEIDLTLRWRARAREPINLSAFAWVQNEPISNRFIHSCNSLIALFFSYSHFPSAVRPSATRSVLAVAAVGAERIHPRVPHDAAGAGNAFAALAVTVQLGRELRVLGRRSRRGRLVHHEQQHQSAAAAASAATAAAPPATVISPSSAPVVHEQYCRCGG